MVGSQYLIIFIPSLLYILGLEVTVQITFSSLTGVNTDFFPPMCTDRIY